MNDKQDGDWLYRWRVPIAWAIIVFVVVASVTVFVAWHWTFDGWPLGGLDEM